MLPSNRTEFENILFSANDEVLEIKRKLGRVQYSVILVVNGIKVAMRLTTKSGTFFYKR